MESPHHIALRGVEVHNLKGIDLDIPHGKLVVLCGVSGSGKSSLALDTLYAEGQRRYIESFSAYTRQFLQRLERPDADRIDGIPPAIAVTSRNGHRSSRSTVGTATETNDYLRLLFARIGEVYCVRCGQPVRRDTAQNSAETLCALPQGTRYLIAFGLEPSDDEEPGRLVAALREEGFIRVIVGDRLVHLGETPEAGALVANAATCEVVVDRLAAGAAAEDRVRDSLEIAFTRGKGRCVVFVEESGLPGGEPPMAPGLPRGNPCLLDGRPWRRIVFSTQLACGDCGLEYPVPEPRLYSFNSPLGACPKCEGFGNIIDLDMDLIVPDRRKSIQEGAIAPWNSPAYAHELEELLALAPDYGIPVDVPFSRLEPEHLERIQNGVPERNFGGLRGFFAWLERRKYKMHIRVFLSRWRSYRPCPACGGTRLRPEALATRLGGKNFAEIVSMKVRDAAAFFADLALSPWQRQVGRMALDQVRARLGFLDAVGLGYLTLDRTLRTLSGGELRRVALTSALGSSLVNMLYVLDEPSIGLHPRDINRLIGAILGLRDRGNTVVVVEHEEAIIRAADQVIEIGPGAGERGGRLVFQGTPQEMLRAPESLTGDYLAGRRGIATSGRRRTPEHGWIRLSGARGNNLRNLTVEFPLGVLCVVTGVSGSGKSTLVQDTLYPALCRRLHKEAPKPYDFDDIYGDGQIDDLVLVDQSPIGRSPRSNPVTYLKAFDEIRAVFAETPEARTRGYTASHFSFNADEGRCGACQGEGHLEIDMQFLADVYMRCSRCNGRRYRDEILEVTYRGRNIAEVLEMTVREAFTFFRGRPKVQARLKRLIDVGLDYVRLGQPANTLSGGEAQRLKLAGYMSAAKRGRCLFLLDEPTTGLHFSDIVQLLDCFDALLAVGHSLIVVEHNLQMIKAADYVIDLGPGAADEGGRIVVQGTPEMVANHPTSITGQYLREVFSRDASPTR
ncbi:MAG: excinuclease ABC subunit UvrA [Thermoguttaceae bacterium]|jgi:excinuclease ABC subunit A|nr:excinuclease ABC subunit UvrA [Thermoguttaceae bacterium]